ncbi:HicB-like antitoxin [Mycobacterium phage Kashi_RDG1]|nr:HicB-like antitoxin [Mycobacterium phage Kashi_RDG1]
MATMTITRYTAVVTPGEQYTLIHVPEIDQWTQARSDDEIEPMARDLIATWLDVPVASIEVVVQRG